LINIRTEQLITLQQATAHLPPGRNGRPRRATTVMRWIVARKLEGARIGCQWVTSLEALQRFMERETIAALGGEPAPVVPALTKERQRAIERATKEAEALGL
jgi:hypothetical protein